MDSHVEADLPPALACLKGADTLLRCPICFDFLSISMMTKCSHNFCSLCIRKFLSYKLQCPVCNTGATEDDLRNNRILDDLVLSFRAARQQLSKVTFDSPPISPKTPASTLKCKTPREKSQRGNTSNLSHYFQRSYDPHLHPVNASTSTAVKEEPMDVQVHTPTASVSQVECPVCSVSVSQQFINKHLDMCLSSGEKKESLRSSIGKGRRPMSKLVYNLLSTAELKRRLKECHLSVQGSRDQMIKRHKEFVHVYNAQCDSLNPKSAEEIAKEVETNEKIKNQLQSKAKPVMVFTKNTTEEEINEMHSKYRKQHSSDFSRLIAQVRGRLDDNRQSGVKQEVTVEGEDEEKPQSTGTLAGSGIIMMTLTDVDRANDHVWIKLSMSPTYSEVSVSRSVADNTHTHLGAVKVSNTVSSSR
uniref:RING-type E3 ubiquitin transferase n=1 Tax=Cynoglossus semilaevis TaxID=244447 RepID=A0A3P8UL02_CYNSE